MFLPYTLPGEVVRTSGLTRRGQGWTGGALVSQDSSFRQVAPCPHFGECGGCSLQHWQDGPYAAWKSAQLATALTRAGFADVALEPLSRTPPGDRRRMDFALSREPDGVRVGLHRHRGREVIDLRTCLVLHPRLVALIAALRETMPAIGALKQAGSLVANLLDSGIDLLLRTDGELAAADRTALAALAQRIGACRIAWAGPGGGIEPAAQLAPVTTALSGATVSPPPGAFLQASRAGEAAILSHVLAGLPKLAAKAHIVELFAGCGTLTFALATQARVSAYEGDPAAHAALRRAAAGHRITAIHRDLARQPLTAKDMAGAAAVVLDPPYAGAGPQMPAIAQSGAARVVYVSCNPGALTRDARVLHAAGYRVERAAPIDQFLWAAAVESVVVFARR